MKKYSWFWRMLCALLILVISVGPVNALDDTSGISSCHGIDASVPLLGTGRVLKNATSAILYEYKTDTLLYSWEADAPIYPASLVKILTALIVVQKGNLEEIVTVKQEVLDTVASDAVSADLLADEVLTVEDLLYCMMVSSANDAAAVLADHISGSQDAFVVEMNQYAAQLGCTATNFTNVHGLHNEEQVTTVRDVTRILSEAVKNATFMEVFGAAEYTVDETNKSASRNLITGNYLMSMDEVEIYYDARVTGGRTGTTAAGDLCIASTASDSGLDVICIISGARSVYEENGTAVTSFGGFPETTQLLDLCLSGYQAAQILYENQALRQSNVVNGESDVILGPKEAIYTVLPAGTTLDSLRFVYNDLANELTAPIEKDQLLSTVEIWNGTICLGQTDLYALNSVSVIQNSNGQDTGTESSIWTQIATVLGIILIVALVVLFVLRLIRAVRITSRKNRSRRYRRSRRRS